MAFETDAAVAAPLATGALDIQARCVVQREVGAFGGDARRVVIHGQSSGAGLVEPSCRSRLQPPLPCRHQPVGRALPRASATRGGWRD